MNARRQIRGIQDHAAVARLLRLVYRFLEPLPQSVRDFCPDMCGLHNGRLDCRRGFKRVRKILMRVMVSRDHPPVFTNADIDGD